MVEQNNDAESRSKDDDGGVNRSAKRRRYGIGTRLS